MLSATQSAVALAESLGHAVGSAIAPFTGAISGLRRSRMFHPRGLLCHARATPAPADSALAPLAEALAGDVLLRWSSALWKHGEWRDVLGCALRFGSAPWQTTAGASDQDLLLATIQRPWTMPFAPFSTRAHDFLDNAYYGVCPFELRAAASLGRIDVRLVAVAVSPAGGCRSERLRHAVQAGAALELQACAYNGPFCRPVQAAFRRVLRIELESWVALDQEALRFDPFRCGRGLTPVGFVHAMRAPAYAASQALRPGAGASSG